MRAPGFLQPTTPHGRLPDHHRDGKGRGLDLGRLLLGLTVVTIGVLFLLDAGGVVNADRAIGDWWPLVIIAGGVLTLAERPPALMRGTILTGIGVLLLLFTTLALGGIEILVPKGWRLSVRSTPIFGGVDDSTDHSEPPAADAPVLHIDALTMFGGVAIKHQK